MLGILCIHWSIEGLTEVCCWNATQLIPVLVSVLFWDLTPRRFRQSKLALFVKGFSCSIGAISLSDCSFLCNVLVLSWNCSVAQCLTSYKVYISTSHRKFDLKSGSLCSSPQGLSVYSVSTNISVQTHLLQIFWKNNVRKVNGLQ